MVNSLQYIYGCYGGTVSTKIIRIEYFRIICHAANSTPGLSWVVYDNQFRTLTGNDHDIYWGSNDMQLGVKLFCVSPSRLSEEYDIFEMDPEMVEHEKTQHATSIAKQVPTINSQTVGSHIDATSQVVGGSIPDAYAPKKQNPLRMQDLSSLDPSSINVSNFIPFSN